MAENISGKLIIDYSDVFKYTGDPSEQKRFEELMSGTGEYMCESYCDKFNTTRCRPSRKCISKLPEIEDRNFEISKNLHFGRSGKKGK